MTKRNGISAGGFAHQSIRITWSGAWWPPRESMHPNLRIFRFNCNWVPCSYRRK